MNVIYEGILKGMRKLLGRIPDAIPPFMDPDAASDAIASLLRS